MLGWLATTAGRIGLTALYKVVKGFFDSWYADQQKRKHEEMIAENARLAVSQKVNNETFRDYRDRVAKREKLEGDHAADSYNDTLERMRRNRTERNKD